MFCCAQRLFPSPSQWQYNLGNTTICPIALTTGLLIIGDSAGVLHALGQYVKPTPSPGAFLLSAAHRAH
jgi:hypothetical protein